jgi:hypothetical protein
MNAPFGSVFVFIYIDGRPCAWVVSGTDNFFLKPYAKTATVSRGG